MVGIVAGMPWVLTPKAEFIWNCGDDDDDDDDDKDVIASAIIRTCAISDVVFRSTARLLRLLVLFILRSRFMIILCFGP